MKATRTAARVLGAAALIGGLLWAPTASQAGPPPAGAVITNGQTQIGLNNTGDLNFTGVGIAFNGADGIAPGCDCEGWGVGDDTTNIEGHAGRSFGVTNVNVESFTSTANSAVSVTTIDDAADVPMMRVTHDYHPSAAPNVFEVAVTIENLSAAPIEPRYRRVMDWDIPPTAFTENVTIQGSEAASAITFSSDDGFATGNPFAAPTHINFIGDAVDNLNTVLDPGGNGPSADHGALFDFAFPTIPVGGDHSFETYYGAAANETGAITALSQIDAEVYSFGQPSSANGASQGVPNTFIFAFAGVGGVVQVPTVEFSSPTYSVEEDDGNAVITVELSAPSGSPVTVTYTSTAGTATAGDDYTDVTGELVIPAGEPGGTFQVPVVDDGIADSGETVTLTLSSPINANPGGVMTAVLTINDPTPGATPVPAPPTFTG